MPRSTSGSKLSTLVDSRAQDKVDSRAQDKEEKKVGTIFLREEAVLTLDDVMLALSDKLPSMGFANIDENEVYPAKVEEISANEIMIDMADGSSFKIKVEEV